MAYNPGIDYRGDRYLFEGAKAAGENMGQALQELAKVRAEDQFLGEAMQSLAKQRSQMGLGEVDPETMQRFFSGSIGAKRGIVSGMGAELSQFAHQQEEQRKAKAQEANMAYQGAIIDQMKAKAAEAQEYRARDKAFNDELQGMLGGAGTAAGGGDTVINPLQDGTGLRAGELRQETPVAKQDLTAQKMIELGAKHGVIDPAKAAELMERMADKKKIQEDRSPRTMRVAGRDVIYSPTGQFQVMPAQGNEDAPVREIRDEGGDVIGHQTWNGKQWVNLKTQPTEINVQDVPGLPEWVMVNGRLVQRSPGKALTIESLNAAQGKGDGKSKKNPNDPLGLYE